MKKTMQVLPTTAAHNSSCFLPIQSFDLGVQDPLLELFGDASLEVTMKHESATRAHHHQQPAVDSPVGAVTPPPNSLVFLTAALPVPPQLDPPMKRRKRRVPSTPKHVEDLARLQEMSSSENSDSERGGSVKLQIRKLKNRASAAKSRIKAQARQEQLEKNVVELHRQNTYLRDLVIAMAKATGHPLPVMPQQPDESTAFDIVL
jgi:hypothetical protein